MLHSRSKPAASLPEAVGRAPAAQSAAPPSLHGNLSDSAIDIALCRVPLPDGLLSRLDAAFGTMADDDADSLE